MQNKTTVRGGRFMVQATSPADVFIPEEFNEEQRMIAQTCQDFLDAEVFPRLDDIDHQEEGLMAGLLTKAGELGLLGISVDEEYMGFGQSVITGMLASEVLGSAHSFAVAFSCHTGIGTLPIAYYGNEKQKAKYLTKLATGEWKGAYCLTEPGAGSDANSGKTQAVLSEDGQHYILNGQKMWITNAGFADVLTVFAKIDNDRVLSAFILERNFPGITFNPEENKMGIKGSSTRQIFFNDVRVPVENLLAGRGQGFRIALSILHMGRLKLGANVVGAAKRAINHSVQYANDRKQFGEKISSFGSIQHKLAEQVIKTFATESAVYRASYDVDLLAQEYKTVCTTENPTITAYAHMAIESAVLKVFGSEALGYVVDEAVQIHGGMGFSSEMPVERCYRDSRINRIFEGTNEINRILVIDTLLKRGQKKDIDLYEKAEAAYGSLTQLAAHPVLPEAYYDRKTLFIGHLKELALSLIHATTQKFQRNLIFEQEILNNLSDIIMNIYTSESTLLRVQKIESMRGESASAVYRNILDVTLYEATGEILRSAMDAINSFAAGEEREALVKGVNYWTVSDIVNVKEARRRIAMPLIEENRYTL
ncbi:MAG: acyl-CoA dehydrogenase [Bacteroidetes bacterium GWF2_49_14]|nr:MAG: acyl-CoA dehydrogenase [Bacteroidetes bacterium GWF2_49_14]HBB90554.1 acyl-CoA dehydrogenase [Bacteroidales bacterium]